MSSVNHLAASRHIRAVLAPTGAKDAADKTGHGIAYVSQSRLASQAMCTCNTWSGRPRLLTALATQDAQRHAIETGCEMAYPLVAPRGTRWVPC